MTKKPEVDEVCPQCQQFCFLSFCKCPICGYELTKEAYEYVHEISDKKPEVWEDSRKI